MMYGMGTVILRTAFVVLLLTATVIVSQAQNDVPAPPNRDLAAAYYHYMLARMYVDKVAKSHDPQDASKAVENYRAAIKADPEATTISEELEKFERGGRRPLVRLSPISPPPLKSK
jgi:hypothetical protein